METTASVSRVPKARAKRGRLVVDMELMVHFAKRTEGCLRTVRQRTRLTQGLKRVLAAALVGVCGAFAPVAEAGPLPTESAAKLLVKAARYDKNFLHRAGDRVRVILVFKPDDRASVSAVAEMQAALTAFPEIDGVPHDETIHAYDGAPELAATCRANRASIVYISTGFSGDIGDIRYALDGIDILSVAANPEDVAQGLVLGFDLVAGKPKLLVHLSQARRQNVAFMADFLKLSKVYN